MRAPIAFLAGLALAAASGCRPPAPPPGAPPGREGRLPEDRALAEALEGLAEPAGRVHVIQRGDTFYALARRYGVPVAAVFAANPGVDATHLTVGQEVVIPGGGAEVGPEPAPVRTPDRGRLRHPAACAGKAAAGAVPGMEFEVPAGSTVVAAADGRVVVAAAELGGLGPTLMIDHGGGLVTLYGRMADFAVRGGQSVKRGQALGRCGAAGLLFRVYEGAAPRAPAGYLK